MWNDLFYFEWTLQPVFNLVIDVHVSHLREKKQQAESLFRLNFNVSADVDNRERARASDKNKGDEFR